MSKKLFSLEKSGHAVEVPLSGVNAKMPVKFVTNRVFKVISGSELENFWIADVFFFGQIMFAETRGGLTESHSLLSTYKQVSTKP